MSDNQNPYEYRSSAEARPPSPVGPNKRLRLFLTQLAIAALVSLAAGSLIAMVLIDSVAQTELAGLGKVPTVYVAATIYTFVLLAFFVVLLIVGWDAYLKRLKR